MNYILIFACKRLVLGQFLCNSHFGMSVCASVGSSESCCSSVEVTSGRIDLNMSVKALIPTKGEYFANVSIIVCTSRLTSSSSIFVSLVCLLCPNVCTRNCVIVVKGEVSAVRGMG